MEKFQTFFTILKSRPVFVIIKFSLLLFSLYYYQFEDPWNISLNIGLSDFFLASLWSINIFKSFFTWISLTPYFLCLQHIYFMTVIVLYSCYIFRRRNVGGWSGLALQNKCHTHPSLAFRSVHSMIFLPSCIFKKESNSHLIGEHSL